MPWVHRPEDFAQVHQIPGLTACQDQLFGSLYQRHTLLAKIYEFQQSLFALGASCLSSHLEFLLQAPYVFQAPALHSFEKVHPKGLIQYQQVRHARHAAYPQLA